LQAKHLFPPRSIITEWGIAVACFVPEADRIGALFWFDGEGARRQKLEVGQFEKMRPPALKSALRTSSYRSGEPLRHRKTRAKSSFSANCKVAINFARVMARLSRALSN
jgi:hypothetical protein